MLNGMAVSDDEARDYGASIGEGIGDVMAKKRPTVYRL